MRRRLIAGLILSAPMFGSEQLRNPEPIVLVYMRTSPIVDNFVREAGQRIATKIFAGIGVKLEWLLSVDGPERGRCRPPECLLIEMLVDRGLAGKLPEDALGSAKLHGARRTVSIFYDRVMESTNRSCRAHLLGHAMAHEIAHSLQQVARHSDTGIMRSKWTTRDFDRMFEKPLAFAEEDRVLIHAGLGKVR